MKIEKYQLKTGEDLFSYDFISEGVKGRITKHIGFKLVNERGIYNLSLGDIDPLTGEIDYEAVSNNGDGEKVLATVVSAIFAFWEDHPYALIYARGNTASRTRLYQIGINKYYDEIKDMLDIYGKTENGWFPFKKNMNCLAFAAQLKTS
jgi:hypothetical protein